LAKNPYIPINPDTTPGITDTSTSPTGNGSPTIYTATVTTVNCTVNTVMTSPNVYTFDVIPAPGYKFQSWSGDNTSSNDPLSLTLTGNINLTATCVPLDTWDIEGSYTSVLDMLRPAKTCNSYDVPYYIGQTWSTSSYMLQVRFGFPNPNSKVYVYSIIDTVTWYSTPIYCKWPVPAGSYSTIDITLTVPTGQTREIRFEKQGEIFEIIEPTTYDYNQRTTISVGGIYTMIGPETKTFRVIKKLGGSSQNFNFQSRLLAYSASNRHVIIESIKTFDKIPTTTHPMPYQSRLLYPITTPSETGVVKDGYNNNAWRFAVTVNSGGAPQDFNTLINYANARILCTHDINNPSVQKNGYLTTGGNQDVNAFLTQRDRVIMSHLSIKQDTARVVGTTNYFQIGGNSTTDMQLFAVIDRTN
jgi:hypothetical protein